ncbi:uncharacterized protein ELE39_000619 [Cryptosporidium sp. chipmunk genotype I]|uniref:uncharacterized protein n=1 Tax=Cryptosporidium sp. chipmunk genotype I TaxID=1280935 RepID=UPI00351A35D3|nr:hypothetical protein ELE39_000619 [Cryptosporidium sp. chipmunk genotype I]
MSIDKSYNLEGVKNEKMVDSENEIQTEEKELEAKLESEGKEYKDTTNNSFERKPTDSDKFGEFQNDERNINNFQGNYKVNSKQIIQGYNMINEKTNKYNEDCHKFQSKFDLSFENKAISLEKVEKSSKAENVLIEQVNNETPKSALKLGKISYKKEMSALDKESKKIIFKTSSKDRREEIKEVLDNISHLKSKASQKETCVVGELLISKGIYYGMHTELLLYEELLKYLFTKRDLNEETFESSYFEDDELLIDQFDSNAGNLFHLEIENTETYYKRRSVFENIIDFAVERISINKNYFNKLGNPEVNIENGHLKSLNAYCELFNRDNVIFFEDTIICDEYFNNCLVPLQSNKTSLNLSSTNFNLKIHEVKKEIDILSSYSTNKEWQIFEKSINEFNFLIKSFGINDFLLENNLCSFFLSERFDKKYKKKLNNSLINLNPNISKTKINFYGIRYFKENLMNKLFRKKLEVIEYRLNSLYKFLLPGEEINEKFNCKSIFNRLINVENMLQAIIPKSYSSKDIFQTKIQMENNLLNGFIISDIRKSDLKKISNLVKSKVSSYVGRSSKLETEGCDTEISENELYKKEENKKIKSILEELDTIGNEDPALRLDDLPMIASRLVKKESAVESFLSNIERIEKCEKMRTENLISLKKIQDITNILLGIMKKNLKFDELNISNDNTKS